MIRRIMTLTLAVSCAAVAGADEGPTLSDLVLKLLASSSGGGRRKAAKRITSGNWDFDEVYRELSKDRRYAANVKVGLVDRTRRNRSGVSHRFLLAVPQSYSPARRYPVRVHLHGGVARPAWEGAASWVRMPERFLSEDRISILPAGWAESKWWQASQVENLLEILREVKLTYNVDENRISLTGASDGGTGAWYFAFRCPTPWASYVSLIGSPNVLANPAVGVEGSMFVANVVGKSFLAINASTDPLYPAESERPLLDSFRNAGADVTFEIESGGHETSWYPRRAPQIEAFIDAHPRDPLPDRVILATERTDRANRMSWLVIDELADAPAKLAVLGRPPKRAGGLVAERRGNMVEVAAVGVRRYRLLISPEEFDLGADVVVRTNGQESFRGRVTRSLDTLLEWAAEDVDRSMLFAAQIEIAVPPGSEAALATPSGSDGR